MDIEKYLNAGIVTISQEEREDWHDNSILCVDLQGHIPSKKILLLLKALVQAEAERDAMIERWRKDVLNHCDGQCRGCPADTGKRCVGESKDKKEQFAIILAWAQRAARDGEK